VGLGPNQPLLQWISGPLTGGKAPWRGVDHTPRSSAEDKKEILELYRYSALGFHGLL